MEGPWLVSYVALWIVVILQIVLVLGLARELGILHRRFGSPGALMTESGLEIGAVAPTFKGIEVPSGREVSFQPTGEKDALVVFVSPTCGACRELLRGLAAGWQEWQRQVSLAFVCEGEEAEVRALLLETGAQVSLVADPLTRIREGYGQPSVPFAYLLDPTGAVSEVWSGRWRLESVSPSAHCWPSSPALELLKDGTPRAVERPT